MSLAPLWDATGGDGAGSVRLGGALPWWRASRGEGGGGCMWGMACMILEKGTMWPSRLRGPAVCVMQLWGGSASNLGRAALFWRIVACLWLLCAACGGVVRALLLEDHVLRWCGAVRAACVVQICGGSTSVLCSCFVDAFDFSGRGVVCFWLRIADCGGDDRALLALSSVVDGLDHWFAASYSACSGDRVLRGRWHHVRWDPGSDLV